MKSIFFLGQSMFLMKVNTAGVDAVFLQPVFNIFGSFL